MPAESKNRDEPMTMRCHRSRVAVFLASTFMLSVGWGLRLHANQPGPAAPAPSAERTDAAGAHSTGEIAAQVFSEAITLRSMEEALRDHLWRTGRVWSDLTPEEEAGARRAVIDKLVGDRLVRTARTMEGFQVRNGPAAGEEWTAFSRQFEIEGDYQRRLGLRQMTEAQLKDEMREALDDQAWIESKLAALTAEVTDEDVAAWLRDNREKTALPARYGVAHIYLTTHDPKKPDREPEIREIYRKLMAGEAAFGDLAAEFSDDERTKKHGGTLGWCARGRMPDDFMDAVGQLGEGQTSGPVETKLGWHIIHLIEKQPARVPSIAELRSEVGAMLRNQRRAGALATLMAGLRSRHAGVIRLNEAVIGRAEPAR